MHVGHRDSSAGRPALRRRRSPEARVAAPLVLLLPLALPAVGCGRGSLDVVDEAAFGAIVPEGARLRKLAGGLRLTEGPAWTAARGGRLVLSDVNGDRLLAWSEGGGLEVLREPGHLPNGNAFTPEGDLVTCEHATRRLTVTTMDGEPRAGGEPRVLVDRYEGRRFHSPNGVAVRADGTVWFTDPPYGLRDPAQRELDVNGVFRLDPATGTLDLVADDFDRPNGVAFGPDGNVLYVTDSGAPRCVRAFDVDSAGNARERGVLVRLDAGPPDGLACDDAGRLYLCVPGGVQVREADGRLLGTILVPETTRDCCFGGPGRRTLFVTAGGSLYAIELAVAGPG